MDLGLFFRVLWRFRLLVALGLVMAFTLTILSVARVDFSGGSPQLVYRQKEQWQSYTTLIISPRGFPYGRTGFSPNDDPSRYGTLATIYSNLAQSDAVRRIMARDSKIRGGSIVAQPILASANNSSAPPLPLMTIAATTSTGARAVAIAERATAAFLDFLHSEQSTNGIPKGKRVVVSEIKRATPAVLLKGRSKTTPVAVFLAVMIVCVGLAFMLENLRPRVHAVSSDSTDDRMATARRSA